MTAPESSLPIAVRAHAVPKPKPDRRPSKSGDDVPVVTTRPSRVPGKKTRPPALLVFDTETTTDRTQRLLFGSWRYYRPRRNGVWQCVQEGLFHADDLDRTDPTAMAVLRNHAAGTWGVTGQHKRLMLLSRAQFVEQILFKAAWEGHARVVGFNLPFDLSRIAIGVGEGRKNNRGGFSLILAHGNAAKGYTENKHRPRVQVKHMNAHWSTISFTKAMGDTPRWNGDFVDLRTLTFALTARGHSLDSACQAFGVPGKADPGTHGIVTPNYIDYCRQDVAATAALYEAADAELAKLDLPLTAPYALSPASLAKATLDGLGVLPVLNRHPDTPPHLLGVSMSSFYGGRAECRIRKTPVPVRMLDFKSAYPTVDALAGIWAYVIAEQINVDEASAVTRDVQQMLERVTIEGCFDPGFWPQLVGFAQIKPDGDILPVRAKYDPHDPSWGVGVNPLTSDAPLWYALPDLVGSTLLTGKTPVILRAVRLHPVGAVDGLQPLPLPGGRVVDPRIEDPFKVMTEHRQRVRSDPNLTADEKDRVQLFLKITANAGAYGIWVEYNRDELPVGVTRPVTVHSRNDETFTERVAAPEQPGRFCYPPLAAVITAGARLLLAMLERCVTDLGGTWAMADTDSMAIVATPDGGLIPCPGGPYLLEGQRAVRALPYAQVEQIRERFARLNPFDQTAIPGSILKVELDATCYAIAAKRYALYRLDQHGQPRLVAPTEHAPCRHGLGHLLNPIDPDADPEGADWITQLWEHELARAIGSSPGAQDPAWYSQSALGRINATSPGLLRAFDTLNAAKPYANQVKPFNFLIFAPGAQPPANQNPHRFRLVAPYGTAKERRRVTWVNLHDPPNTYKLSTDPTRPGTAITNSHSLNALRYFSHPEAKSADQDLNTCTRSTEGLLQRRPVIVRSITHIGKESNKLDQRETGELTADETEDLLLEYRDPTVDNWRNEVLPLLRQLPPKEVAVVTGLSERRLRDTYAGRSTPHRATQERLRRAISELLPET